MNYFYPHTFRQPTVHSNETMYKTNPSYAIPLLKEAVKDERTDELFYDYLIQHAPSQEDRDVIKSIRNDERKHRKMFGEMYYSLTRQKIEADKPESFQPPASYLEGLKRAIFGES